MTPLRLQTTPKLIDGALEWAPEHWRPICMAMRDHSVRLILVPQSPYPFLAPLDAPFIAVVGDDMQEALGPRGFSRPSLRRLIGAASAVAIVACEPLPVAYAGIAASAVAGRSAVLIETRPARQDEWHAFVSKANPEAPLLICSVAGESAA